MANKFCKHLSNGYRINIDNSGIKYAPCCYWQGPSFTFDKPIDDIKKDRVKLDIETPWIHSACNRCRAEEAYKDRNYRIAGNLLIADDLPSAKVGWLDIQADMTCNAGCLICGPWNSSYWEGQMRAHDKSFFMSKKPDLQQAIQTIFEKLDVSELQHVQFLGGEPFLSNIDQLAFPYITNPEKCLLSYATNGSIDPDQDRMSHWTKFKSVMINYSIDGIGQRFEYLRYPLEWHTVERNVKKMIAADYDNIIFHINHTVTPLNILYYNEFIDWVNDTFPRSRFKGIHTHTAYGTMSVSNISEKLKDMVITKYGEAHMLSKMVSQTPLTDNKHFLEYIDTWDTRRKQSWRKTFPDLVNCL